MSSGWLLLDTMVSPAITTAFSYLCAFVGVKTFVDVRAVAGLHGTFWTYAAITLAGVGFYWAAVPEMKQAPLEEWGRDGGLGRNERSRRRRRMRRMG